MAKRAEPNNLETGPSGLSVFLGKVWDALAAPLGEAIADIRKKVVEEGYFGREVTPREIHLAQQPNTPAQPSLGFKELMSAQAAIAPKEPRQAPDHGMEI